MGCRRDHDPYRSVARCARSTAPGTPARPDRLVEQLVDRRGGNGAADPDGELVEVGAPGDAGPRVLRDVQAAGTEELLAQGQAGDALTVDTELEQHYPAMSMSSVTASDSSS